jgi:hypothetical protein
VTAAVEDTKSYNVQVIDAHSDLSLFVLVLDAYLLGGALPNNSDIEAAYRLRKVLRLTDSESFFAILAHLARDEAATAILQRIQSCEEGVGVPQCLREFAPPP